MARKGIKRQTPLFELASERGMTRIEEATLEVMRDVGIVVEDKAARAVYSAIGCKVDESIQRVRFPEEVVMKYMAMCPSSYNLKGITPERDVFFTANGSRTYFGAGCAMKLYDIDADKIRKPTRKEFYDSLIVLDNLENCDLYHSFPMFGFEGVPDCLAVIESAAAKFRVGGKPQIEGSITDEYIWLDAMARALDVDCIQVLNSIAPQTYYADATERLKFYAEHGNAIQITPGPSKGLTCPTSNAGAVVANNAETCAGIIYTQAVCPGTRIMSANMMMTPNMSTGEPSFGDVGFSIHEALLNQSWRRMQVPAISVSTSWTSSAILDYQAGYELTTMLMSAVMSGSSAVMFMGALHAELSFSPVKAIMDNDVAGILKRFTEGIVVDDDTLAVDVIKEVGPCPSSFLETDHTLERWRDETYLPLTANRTSFKKWERDGRKDSVDLAKDKYNEIINKGSFHRLTEQQESALEYILNDARNYYRKKGMISDDEWAAMQKDISSDNYPFA